MDIHELHRTGDDETLSLLRRLRDEADDVGRSEREIVALVIDLLGPRPVPALIAYRRLVEEYLPWMEQRLVRRARRRGSSWAGIGRALHRSRQAVHQRFQRTLTLDECLPPPRHLDLDDPDVVRSRRSAADHLRTVAADEASADNSLVPW